MANVADDAKLFVFKDGPRVTFKEFQSLARKRGWTVDFLTEKFTGTIDQPREFFTRVLSCKYQGEYRGGVAIPYRSVLAFYAQEKKFMEEEKGRLLTGYA